MKVSPASAGLDERRLERITEHLQARYIDTGRAPFPWFRRGIPHADHGGRDQCGAETTLAPPRTGRSRNWFDQQRRYRSPVTKIVTTSRLAVTISS